MKRLSDLAAGCDINPMLALISSVSACIGILGLNELLLRQIVDDLQKRSTGESRSVSADDEDQLAFVKEVLNLSQDLAKLAQDLQLAVARFRG